MDTYSNSIFLGISETQALLRKTVSLAHRDQKLHKLEQEIEGMGNDHVVSYYQEHYDHIGYTVVCNEVETHYHKLNYPERLYFLLGTYWFLHSSLQFQKSVDRYLAEGGLFVLTNVRHASEICRKYILETDMYPWFPYPCDYERWDVEQKDDETFGPNVLDT